MAHKERKNSAEFVLKCTTKTDKPKLAATERHVPLNARVRCAITLGI